MSDARYRRKELVGEVAEVLRSLLDEKAQELDTPMEVLEIIPDHALLFIKSDPSGAPQRLANPFKGYPSRRLRWKYPALRSRLASMWRRSSSVGTIGHVSEETVLRYLKMQK